MPQNGAQAGGTRHRSRRRHAPIARGIAIAKTTPHQSGPAGSESLRELKLICLSNLLASTEERVYFKDLMSRFLFVSDGWIEAVAPGRTAAELTGKTDFDVFTEEHAASAFADEQEIIRTGEPIVGQVERETFSGRPDIWVSTTKVPLRDDRGEIIGTFGISRDITAQIRAESALALQAGELGAQNERLRELDRLKDEFVALVSHELRTPLTSIIGYIQLLRDERASGLDTDHFAEVIERNAERLLRLVGDLLFLSKMQTGQLALELRDTDLASLAGQAVEEARPEAERKHIRLGLSAAPVPSAVDPTRITQLLGNLITNAVKFTPEGGQVEVRLAADGGEAVLSVTDTGIGIPAADRERIFERFYRTEAATRRVIPGSGLGLTISRAIVDAHRGTITVRSDGTHGSTFTVRLPLALGSSAWWRAYSASPQFARPGRDAPLVVRPGERPAPEARALSAHCHLLLTRCHLRTRRERDARGERVRGSAQQRGHDPAGPGARLGGQRAVGRPEAGPAGAVGVAAAGGPGEARDRDPDAETGRDPAGPLLLQGALARGHHGPGHVRVDAEGSGVHLVLGDADVPADGQAEPPAVHLQHGGLVTGGEPPGLGPAEPQLAVGHADPGPVHSQHGDVRATALAGHRRARQGDRPGLGARLGQRAQPRIGGREGRRAQLVSGQRELGEDHDPGRGGAHRRGVRHCVLGHVVRHAQRLSDRDAKRFPHGNPQLRRGRPTDPPA